MNFTVASYNIHKCAGLDGRVDLDRTADVIQEIDADLVGLQEVFRPQALSLAERLGVQVAMGPTRERDGLPYGNAILTRLAIRGSRIFDLSQPDREPRGGIRLDLEMAEGPLHLFNVHFGLQIRERAEQVRRLVREHILHDELTGPRVVVGDLNEWFWFPGAVGRTLRRELHGPRIRRTHPAPLPLFPLDRIYWDRDLAADGFHVHRSRLARVASDHLPVVARLRMAPARG
ncbi:MAG TPA: endonuclease/exonuclease/phosphatase family protein [Methylomirabilota bacterium]|jgi:endonuclease/exonuclease/phosphatase family metal-dependent hydrolase|nr:endonuclease/exonuclease/phosphatase family protein [Methylomirabilota bacterium]HWP74207.1 endonuclease/exonuclease/phosphatase family protein [Methylomirabilota bacterium]